MNSESTPPRDYLNDRLIEQRNWHSRKATWNRRRHYTVEIVTLLAGASIPLVNVWAQDVEYWARLISAFLGGAIVVAVGIGKLLKFQENWLQYRAIAEALEREQQFYLAKVGDYSSADAEQRTAMLVDRTEGLLAAATTQFLTTHRATSEAPPPGGGSGA